MQVPVSRRRPSFQTKLPPSDRKVSAPPEIFLLLDRTEAKEALAAGQLTSPLGSIVLPFRVIAFDSIEV